MSRVTSFALFLTLLLSPLALRASDSRVVLPIWPGVPAGSEGKTAPEHTRLSDTGEHIVSSIHRPTLTVVLPPADRATGAAVVVCPGGGYREVWMDHEGYAIAAWLAEHGIAAFILKYRLPNETGSTYHADVETLADARRALQVVRARAAEWQVDPARVGLMGFSAGGHLASLAAARPVAGQPGAADPVAAVSSRPAFQALIYPAIDPALTPAADAPPAFLLCGNEDNLTPPDQLAQLYLRFKSAGVPAELHIFTGQGHGFGRRAHNQHAAAHWLDRFADWLDERGLLRPPTGA